LGWWINGRKGVDLVLETDEVLVHVVILVMLQRPGPSDGGLAFFFENNIVLLWKWFRISQSSRESPLSEMLVLEVSTSHICYYMHC
jgi:hypothetical protein